MNTSKYSVPLLAKAARPLQKQPISAAVVHDAAAADWRLSLTRLTRVAQFRVCERGEGNGVFSSVRLAVLLPLGLAQGRTEDGETCWLGEVLLMEDG